MTHGFTDKLKGALYGIAIGDGMGAPVEGKPPETVSRLFDPEQIRTSFLPPTHGKDPSRGKGHGRITDDTLMTEALIRAYTVKLGHMDAYDFEAYLLPEMTVTQVWIPEFQQQSAIMERLFWAEKYPWMRLAINGAEPRSAGIGNFVNCGAAMYMMPVGAVNAGDPVAAYREAASMTIAHNESFAVEAAAISAASHAAAFAADASIDTVLQAASALARDGTAAAIRDTLEASDPSDPLPLFVSRVRQAVSPYDRRTSHTADHAPLKRLGISDMGRPSREAAIEEVPVALAALKYGNGDFHKTLTAGVFYGRDCDSIASMACSMFGALFGRSALPASLCQASDQANDRRFGQRADEFFAAIRQILTQDQEAFRHKYAAIHA